MGRLYHKLIFLFTVFLVNACSFDHDDIRILSKIDGNYYMADHPGYTNDGIMIVYSRNKEVFQILSSNCSSIYKGQGKIFFSKWVDSNRNNIEYYKLKIKDSSENNQLDEPKLIAKGYFIKNVASLIEMLPKNSLHDLPDSLKVSPSR